MPIQLGSAYGQIIIDASGVQKGTGEAKKEIGGFQKNFENAGKMIAKTTGFIAAEIALLKKVFDFGREGAMIEQTGASFDALMKSINGPTDMLEQLQRASQGTVSAIKLQSATTTLLAGTSEELGKELAGSAAGILEIAKAANKLNPNLGSTEFLYQSLMTGIKRGSPMIIDNTGITLKLGDAYETLAKSLGKNADELTSEEQKMAILRATMEAGGRIIEQVGGNTNSATDSFDRMTVAIQDQADELKARLYPALADAAEGVYQLLTYEENLMKILGQHEGDVRTSAKTWDEYVTEMVRAYVASKKISESTAQRVLQNAKETGSLESLNYALHDFGYEIEFTNQAIFDAIKVGDKHIDMQEKLRGVVEGSAGAYDGLALAIPKTKMSMEELELFMAGPLGAEMDAFYEREGDLETQADDLRGAIDELTAKPWLSTAQKEQLEENKKKLEEIQGQIKKNADEHEIATKRILFDLLQQQLAMDGLTAEEGNALAVVAEKWGLVDQETALAYQKISDYVQQARDGKITVEELADAIEKLGDKDIYLTTHFIETYQSGAPAWQWTGGEGSTATGFSEGGRPPLNQAVMVGEKGPELAVFGSPTTIIPNDEIRNLLAKSGSMGNQAGNSEPVIFQFYLQADGASEEAMERLAWRLQDMVLAKLGG